MSVVAHSVASIKEFISPNHVSGPARSQLGRAYGTAFKDGLKGNLLNVPFVAFEVGSAKEGEKISTLAARGAGMLTYPALAGTIALGVAMIPGVNVAAAGLIAGIIAMYPNSLFEESAIRKINWLNKTGKQIRHLEIGGQYTDTDYAERLRQNTLMELSSARGASRRYLGNEGLIHHR